MLLYARHGFPRHTAKTRSMLGCDAVSRLRSRLGFQPINRSVPTMSVVRQSVISLHPVTRRLRAPEFVFSGQAPSEPSEAAVLADHAMAGNMDGNGLCPTAAPTARLALAGPRLCNRAVAGGVPTGFV